MVLITEMSVLYANPKHRYSKGADGPLGIKSVAGWGGKMSNRTQAGLPERRWIIAQMQTCWKNLFQWSNFTHYWMQDVPRDIYSCVKIPCRGGQRGGGNKWVVMRVTLHWKQRATSHVQGKKDPCLPSGVYSPITYSCRRLFILAKASAWIERMALSPRFLQNTTKGNVNKRDAMAVTKSLHIQAVTPIAGNLVGPC